MRCGEGICARGAASSAQLVLVGDGPDRSAAEWLAHDLGIHSRVHFLGKQERVNELLALADLLLMPSELESFGLAALEAMACKVPSIATRVGGVPELIDDGVTGLLYPCRRRGGNGRGRTRPAQRSSAARTPCAMPRESSAKALLRQSGGAAVCAVLRAGAGETAAERTREQTRLASQVHSIFALSS